MRERVVPMLALERQREIVAVLTERGSARVAELARQFDVTEETIRRDLEKLEAEHKLVRSHGGAVTASEPETPHWQREFVNQPQKEALAREAVKLVEEGDILMLDASSSCWFLARRLPDIPLTIITNSLHTCMALAGREHFRVICPGGTLVETSMSFVGAETQHALRRYHAGKFFMSCRGLDLLRGASDLSEEQAMVRRMMLEGSDHHVLLVDSTKLQTRALSIIAPIAAFHHLITDDAADAETCAAFQQAGLQVTRVAVIRGGGAA